MHPQPLARSLARYPGLLKRSGAPAQPSPPSAASSWTTAAASRPATVTSLDGSVYRSGRSRRARCSCSVVATPAARSPRIWRSPVGRSSSSAANGCVPRRYRGRDIILRLMENGRYDQSAHRAVGPPAPRRDANTDLGSLSALGITLLGQVSDVTAGGTLPRILRRAPAPGSAALRARVRQLNQPAAFAVCIAGAADSSDVLVIAEISLSSTPSPRPTRNLSIREAVSRTHHPQPCFWRRNLKQFDPYAAVSLRREAIQLLFRRGGASVVVKLSPRFTATGRHPMSTSVPARKSCSSSRLPALTRAFLVIRSLPRSCRGRCEVRLRIDRSPVSRPMVSCRAALRHALCRTVGSNRKVEITGLCSKRAPGCSIPSMR